MFKNILVRIIISVTKKNVGFKKVLKERGSRGRGCDHQEGMGLKTFMYDLLIYMKPT